MELNIFESHKQFQLDLCHFIPIFFAKSLCTQRHAKLAKCRLHLVGAHRSLWAAEESSIELLGNVRSVRLVVHGIHVDLGCSVQQLVYLKCTYVMS